MDEQRFQVAILFGRIELESRAVLDGRDSFHYENRRKEFNRDGALTHVSDWERGVSVSDVPAEFMPRAI